MNTPQYNVVLIDNFDSFTYNLVDEIRCLGHQLVVYRNDTPISVVCRALEHKTLSSLLLISPGPGKPKQAGNVLTLIKVLRRQIPMIGICLGFQAIVEAFGGEIGHADEIVHGKSSLVNHNNTGPFYNLPCPLPVARYHSLSAHTVPDNFSVVAQYGNTPMAIYSEEEKILGFQFHPESILTPQGTPLLKQSLDVLAV
ncbi:MAG: aminodeoxychorismate/anthranilate synthase component II [Cellvibrionaceae bacterium]